MPKSSCLNGLLWSRESIEESTISDLESPSDFQVKEKKLFKSVKKQWNYASIKNEKIVMFKMEMEMEISNLFLLSILSN